MPFRVQCPHGECRKFMLVEDDARGTTIPCLVCEKPIEVAADNVRVCPHCSARMRVSPTANKVKCPSCQRVF